MKKQILYLHGGDSFNDYNKFLQNLQEKDIRDLPSAEPFVKWTKILAANLGEDYEVFMPSMPNSQNAKFNEWKIWFERHFEYLRDDTILIGCSLGAMFLARYFTENSAPFRVKSLILMAGAVNELRTEDCGDFIISLNDVDVINEKVEEIEVWHSKDDFVVPFSHGEALHKAIPGSEFVVFEDKNHFLVEELPEIVEKIKGLG